MVPVSTTSAAVREPAGLGPQLHLAPARAVAGRPVSLYADLKRQVTDAGLLERRLRPCLVTMVLTLLLLVLAVALLGFLHATWLHLLEAALLAVVFTQIGFIGHDVGHGQVLRSGWQRTLLSLLHGNLLLGVSTGWWVDKHNEHHSHPNQLDHDPDIAIPILAFSAEQAQRMQGFARVIGRYQAFALFPLLMLEGVSLRLDSVRYLLQRPARYRRSELLLLALHVTWYLGVLIAVLGAWQALLVAVVHQALFGAYIGSVFAPNHKGMPVLAAASELDFLTRQVVTARNVRGNRLTDFWYGGLNYQIEHHLFPTMPRQNLKHAQRLVRSFCAEHAIPYHETGMLQSYREILQHLHAIGAPLRAERKA